MTWISSPKIFWALSAAIFHPSRKHISLIFILKHLVSLLLMRGMTTQHCLFFHLMIPPFMPEIRILHNQKIFYKTRCSKKQASKMRTCSPSGILLIKRRKWSKRSLSARCSNNSAYRHLLKVLIKVKASKSLVWMKI